MGAVRCLDEKSRAEIAARHGGAGRRERARAAILAGAVIAAVTAWTAPGALAQDGAPIGDWSLSKPVQMSGEPRQYFIATEANPGYGASVSLSLVCAAGRYRLRLIDPQQRGEHWRGVMNLLIDRMGPLAIGARTEDPGDLSIAAFDSEALPAQAMGRLERASFAIQVSLDGWQSPVTFPARDTARAIATLAAACR
jgi:hypothetical protein